MFESLFTVTSYDQLPDWVVDYFEPILWNIGVFFFLATAVFFYNHYKKIEAGKSFSFGLLLFALCFGIARLLENIRKFVLTEDRMAIVKWWVGEGPPLTGLALWLRILYYVLSWFAISDVMYAMEKYVFRKKTKYIFTFASIMEGVVSIGLYFTTGSVQILLQVFATIGFFACGIAPIVVYLIMAIKSTGILRESSFLVAIGLILFVLGVLIELPESSFVTYLTTGEFLDAWLIVVVAPMFLTSGVIILTFGFRKMFTSLF